MPLQDFTLLAVLVCSANPTARQTFASSGIGGGGFGGGVRFALGGLEDQLIALPRDLQVVRGGDSAREALRVADAENAADRYLCRLGRGDADLHFVITAEFRRGFAQWRVVENEL